MYKLYESFIFYSLLIWQITLATFLILRFFNKNNISPMWTQNKRVRKKENIKEVATDVRKNIFINKLDNKNITTDEVKIGEVKTQKNKLKELRR